MASTFQLLLERAEILSTQLCELFGRSPSISPSPSSSQIEEDLERLRRRMRRIRALLDDAEEREIRENRVRLWLDELRDVAYGAEDVIEAFEYEVQRYQMWCRDEEQAPIRSSKKARMGRTAEVSNSFDQPRCAPLSDPSFQQQSAAKIKRVTDLFDEIYGDGLSLKLHEKDDRQRTTNLTSLSDPSARPPTSSLLADEEGILGREVDKHKVIKLLLSDVDGGGRSGKNVGVVSIVGMAGVGKTTLAQLVYNDIPEVRDRFDTRLWIHVSESFEVTRLTKEILEAIQGEPSALQGFNVLQETLQKKMEGKRFLLVLDDVWNESLELWDILLVPLLKAAEGSRVLITTRSEVVSRVSDAIEGNLYRLGYLSFEDSWTLFEQRVFGDRIRSSDHPHLVSIGRKIVRNCGGLPLAVKTLAGLLRSTELSEKMWEDVLRSDLWELPEGQGQILPALRLSYHHLPSAVKPCFAYCAVFPKNHNFDRDALVLMWMAQGYLRATPRHSMEDVGRRHFTDLLQRSFFQEQGNGYYIMHDLTHDLALSVCGGRYCQGASGRGSRILEAEARHVSLERGEDIMRFLSAGPPVRRSTRLRTFGLFKILWGYTCSCKAVNNLLSSMKYLRVLDLRGVEISDLPDSIGNLMLLRYLAVGRSLLSKLPETLGDLLNLQTLDVSEAYNLQELPVRVAELVNLRHLILHAAGHGGLQRMPPGIGRLTQLQTLSRFVVGAGDVAAGIEELTDLNDLKGKLEIKIRSPGNNSWSSNTSPCKEASRKKACSILTGKHGLGSLALIFHCKSDEEMMESLQPHSKIKELEIVGYDGRGLPKWMEAVPSGRAAGAASPFPWLEKLRLHLLGLEGTLTLGSEDGGTSFPCLRHLTIEYCNSLEKLELWHMATLSELRVNCCAKLTRLDCHYDGKVSLGCGSWLLPPPPTSSGSRQQPVVIDHIMKMPHITTIVLRSCPVLTFPPQHHQQLQLSPSLRRFDFTGSDRLKDWARCNVDKAVGASGCHYVIVGAALQGEENFSNDVRVDRSIRGRVVPQGVLELRWEDGPSPWRRPDIWDWDCSFPSPGFSSPPPRKGGEERDGDTSANGRARTKLKQAEVDCEFLKRCCEYLTEENRRLQKEVQELLELKLPPQELLAHMHMTPLTTLTMCPSCERVAVSPAASTSSAPAPSADNCAPHADAHPIRPQQQLHARTLLPDQHRHVP